MEIADLNLIGDFEAGIKCLQNPSLLSKLSLAPKLYSFWTCGALIIAVFATFTNIFIRIKLFIHKTRLRLLSSCQNSCPKQIFDDDDFDFDFDFSSDDGDDDTPSSVAESDDEEMDSEDTRVSEVFRVDGSSYLDNYEGGQEGNFTLNRRNRFSFSDFSPGKSVVQLWDSFGLGLDFEDEESETSIWEMDRDVVVTADMNGGVGFSNGTYDTRVPPGTSNKIETIQRKLAWSQRKNDTYDFRLGVEYPAIYDAWRPRARTLWLNDDGVVGQKEE